MDSSALSKILFSALRVVIAVAAVLGLLWWFGIRMPGKNISKAAPLSPDEVTLREELRADVQKLAGEIGERNMRHYSQLNAAADFIENSFSRAGLHPRSARPHPERSSLPAPRVSWAQRPAAGLGAGGKGQRGYRTHGR